MPMDPEELFQHMQDTLEAMHEKRRGIDTQVEELNHTRDKLMHQADVLTEALAKLERVPVADIDIMKAERESLNRRNDIIGNPRR